MVAPKVQNITAMDEMQMYDSENVTKPNTRQPLKIRILSVSETNFDLFDSRVSLHHQTPPTSLRMWAFNLLNVMIIASKHPGTVLLHARAI